MDVLRHVNFGLDSDVVVAFDTSVNITSNQAGIMNKTQEIQETFLPFRNTSNQTSIINSTITCIPPIPSGSSQETYYLYQVYKIKKNLNTSLVVRPLGIWDSINSTKNLKPFWDIENRGDFHQFPIIVGHYDAAADGPMKESEIDIGKTYFVNYFARFLNSSKQFVGYIKLGHRENGEWTDLLDAIQDGNVDISGQGISKTTDRINAMTYSFDILMNSRNIYIEPVESESLRDIFLIPFDSRLILGVAGTGLILSIAMTINNWLHAKFRPQNKESKRREFSESIVWCVGIFTQQGSIWKTRSLTEKNHCNRSFVFDSSYIQFLFGVYYVYFIS
ncbi:unnamed protein product [Psylliodes chrysocephalus]|uniref:Uncharacterized protein n=1 Tax=Psylliodes chrysocephalus TaxID=3402493 RepID=A0A9P0CKR3_9CUCU|nr:unnamed protein product [Psylliodes chrysocephala]